MAYFIHKQVVPGNNFIWVLKMHDEDTIDSFETLEEAQTYAAQLFVNDETQRVYKVVIKNEDGTFLDAS